MTVVLITLALQAHGPGCSQQEAKVIARAIRPAAERYAIPPLLMAAIVLVETGGSCRLDARRHEATGGYSCGPFQEYIPPAGYLTLTQRRCDELISRPGLASMRTARRLRRALGRCEGPNRPRWCSRGYWARHNPGSPRWCRAVTRIWARVRAWMQSRKGET